MILSRTSGPRGKESSRPSASGWFIGHGRRPSARAIRAARLGAWLLAGVVALGAATTARSQPVTDQYDDAFRKYSKRYFGPGFDWRLFKAQAIAESRLDASAKSWVGARGLMQLMPTTYHEIQSRNPDFQSIDDPVWNIAAGICYDHQLWGQWTDHPADGERIRFVFGSYNAGRGTLLRATSIAERRQLDPRLWMNIRKIAHEVPKWRSEETIGYVDRIETTVLCMSERGRVVLAGDRLAAPAGPAAPAPATSLPAASPPQ